jgi:hypothetical protein
MLAKTDNAPPPNVDQIAFTDAELLVFSRARAAGDRLRRSWDQWVLVGRAVLLARSRAAAIGGHVRGQRALAKTILAEHGLAWAANNVRLIAVMGNLDGAEAYRAGLSDVERARYSSPQSVFNRAPCFHPDGKTKGATIKPHPMLVSELFMKRADEISKLLYLRDPSKAWAVYRSLSELLEGTPKPKSGWSRSREQAAAAGASAAAA